MAERSELEQRVRRMIAADITYRVLKSLGEKGVRRLTKQAKDIVNLSEEEPNERFFARVEKTEEQKARTITEGVEAFEEKYPHYGKILRGLIAETRLHKNMALVYGLNQGYKLSEEDYLQIMMDLGFERREASSIYPHILAISERLKKANEQQKREILLSE